jgi:putative endonuclease
MPAADGATGHDRRARGARVEQAAREHLLAAGLQFVAANVSFRCGELDLVMRDRDRLGDLRVFVVVRYGADAGQGGGADSVDGWKRRKLQQAAQLYLMRNRCNDAPCRFDVVEASGDPGRPSLRWIRDAFRADD